MTETDLVESILGELKRRGWKISPPRNEAPEN
jgi:hypothetical protein